jgi:hypothetical protein
MAAIITENYRKTLANLLQENLQSPLNEYYVGIGKSDAWYEDLSGGLTAPFPLGTSGDTAHVLTSLTDLIKIGADNYSRVIPNVNPVTAPARYKRFNPYDASCLYPSTINGVDYKPAYFIEPVNGNVFLVLDSPGTPLDLSSPGDFFLNGNDGNFNQMATVNGYTVVFIGNINPNSKFNNSQFVKVNEEKASDEDLEFAQYRGAVYGFHIANGGTYVDPITLALVTDPAKSASVTVRQHGVNTTIPGGANEYTINVTCAITNGKITSIRPTAGYYEELIERTLSGYEFNKAIAEITIGGITQTTAATIYPCISNAKGFTYDMTEYTPAWYACFLVNSDVSVQDVYTSYSQVSLIRNPKLDGSSSVLNVVSKNMKKSFKLIGQSVPISPGLAIFQRNSGQIIKRIGVVDSYEQDGSDGIIYYTNSAKYGYDVPSTGVGNTISFLNPANGSIINTTIAPEESSLNTPTIDTADVLFIDNRGKIDRASDQNEELKIIIQL